ncbi:basic amino acid ABC transporter substrate-binding protein [Bacillaceae bacterium S4-13-58]
MKKLGLVTLLLLLGFLAACGTADENSAGNGNDQEEVVIATDAAYAPFEYMDKGEITGFDVDIALAVFEEAGIPAKFENVGWEPMLQSVKNGSYKIGISAISITDVRKETYDFSNPYFESTQMVLVPEGSTIKSAADLEGKKIGVQIATTGATAAEELFGVNNENIKKFETTPLAIMGMNQGDVDAVILDNTVANEYIENNPNEKIEAFYDEEAFAMEYYGFLFPKESELVEPLNEALQAIIDNGTYSEIYKEWFGAEPDLDTLKAAQSK